MDGIAIMIVFLAPFFIVTGIIYPAVGIICYKLSDKNMTINEILRRL